MLTESHKESIIIPLVVSLMVLKLRDLEKLIQGDMPTHSSSLIVVDWMRSCNCACGDHKIKYTAGLRRDKREKWEVKEVRWTDLLAGSSRMVSTLLTGNCNTGKKNKVQKIPNNWHSGIQLHT